MVAAMRRAAWRFPDPTIWAAAAILAVAGSLKIYSPATNWPTAHAVLGLAEIVPACWLLSRWHRRLAESAVASVFSIFALYGISRFWAGEGACQCFGAAGIAASWTLALSVCGAVTFYLRVLNLLTASGAIFLRYSMPVLFIALSALTLARVGHGLTISHSDDPGVKWGQSLLGNLDQSIQDKLRDGQWRVVIVDLNCSKCLEVLGGIASELNAGTAVSRTVVVSINAPSPIAGAEMIVRDVIWAHITRLDPYCVPMELTTHAGMVSKAICLQLKIPSPDFL